uniref:Large ribosomal subunit protein eL20 n=1 Tax=Phocoena sinus TaxID=42100 RepID=A0A8C9EAK1_PHOSS
MKASGTLPEYKVVGHCLLTSKCGMSPLYCMCIFAPNHVAKSCFWYFVSQLKKMRYRDLTTASAVTQCYQDMGTWHRAWAHSIQITKTEEIVASKCCRPAVKQFHDSKIKFPLPYRVLCCQHKPHLTTKRPNTFF